MSVFAAEFAFQTTQHAAAQLHEASRRAGVDLHLIPFSRFDPGSTTWWLSPTAENPAYALGKIIVDPTPIVDLGESNAAVIGFHVEKGIGPTGAPIFEETARGRRMVMRDNWTWRPFLEAMRTGSTDEVIREAEAAARGLPLVVEIVAAMQDAPERDWVRPTDRPDAERTLYGCSDGRLEVRRRQTEKLLARLGESETLSSIAGKIEAIPDLDWTWIEIVAGIPFRPVPSAGLSPDEVWRRACAPWMRWVR
jgi:hypothetical protein